MVGIVVDHDGVAVPNPIVDVGAVKGRDAERPAVEPEAVRAAARQTKLAPESARPLTVLERAIQVKTWIVRSIVMPDPGIGPGIYVRPIGVSGLILKILARLLPPLPLPDIALLLRHIGALLWLLPPVPLADVASLLGHVGVLLWLRPLLLLRARRGLLRLPLRTMRRNVSPADLWRPRRGRAARILLSLLREARQR